MKRYEKEEIRDLPEKYRPLGAWKYFWLQILFAIPVIGFIFLIIFALNGNNINRRSFARSYFCGFLIVVILFGAMYLLGFGTGLLEYIMQMMQSMGQ